MIWGVKRKCILVERLSLGECFGKQNTGLTIANDGVYYANNNKFKRIN